MYKYGLHLLFFFFFLGKHYFYVSKIVSSAVPSSSVDNTVTPVRLIGNAK